MRNMRRITNALSVAVFSAGALSMTAQAAPGPNRTSGVETSIVRQASEPTLTGDVLRTARGDVVIHPVNHASFVMSWQGRIIYVDPVGGPTPYATLPKPDLVLLTHEHGDHTDPDTLNALVKAGTRIVAPAAVGQALPDPLRARVTVMANGDSATLDGMIIEALPMYNTTPERAHFHPKGLGNGYLATFGDKRVYVAGDTEPTPEMLALTNVDVAFVPMNLPYTMTVEQAAEAVRTFKPKVVYPYHYRGSDVKEFERLVGTDCGVEVRLRNWY